MPAMKFTVHLKALQTAITSLLPCIQVAIVPQPLQRINIVREEDTYNSGLRHLHPLCRYVTGSDTM